MEFAEPVRCRSKNSEGDLVKANGVVVIVGAGLSGIRTAEELRRLGHTGRIVMLGAESLPPYDRPPLSKGALAKDDATPPFLLEPEALAALNVDLQLSTEVVGVDTVAHTVTTADGATVDYDVLVIATGAHPRLLGGAPVREGLHVLRTFEDSKRIAADIRRGGRLVVIGGGFIGCEVVATARSMGTEVSMIEALSTPLQLPVGEFIGKYVADLHRENGVDLHCDSLVTRLIGDEKLEGVELSTGEVVEAAAVVVGLGVAPTIEWLKESGLHLDNGVRCDSSGRTSATDVFAVGDVAHWKSTTGREGRHEHWTSAIDQARVVAANILASGDDPLEQLHDLPYFWSDMYGLKLQALGWTGGSYETHVMHLGPNKDKLVVLYSDEDRFIGTVGISAPRIVMSTRTMLQTSTSIDEAKATLLSA